MAQPSAHFKTRPQYQPKEGFRPYGTRSLAPSPEIPPPLQQQQQRNQNNDRGEKNQHFNSNSMVNQRNHERARTQDREFGNSRRTPVPYFNRDHGRTRVDPEYSPPLRRQSERQPPPHEQHQNNDPGERNQSFNSNSMVNQSNRERARTQDREFGNSRRTPVPQFRNDNGRTLVEPERPPPPQRQQQQREQPCRSRSRSLNAKNRNTRQEHQPTSRSSLAVNPPPYSRQPRRSRSKRKAHPQKILRNKIKITSNLDEVIRMMCIDMNQDDIPFVPNIFCHHEVINFENEDESFNQIAALVEHLSK